MQRRRFLVAELAREALHTDWLKLEIHPDPKYLMPDPVETLEAAKELVKAWVYCFAVRPCRSCALQASGRDAG